MSEISNKAKIGQNVKIYPFVYIEDDVEIGDDCVIYPNVCIMNGTKIGKGNKIFQNTVLGAEPQDFNYKGCESHVVIGDNNIIRENVVINRGTCNGGITAIGNENIIMEGVHISHDTKVGNGCVFGYGSKIAGDCIIDDNVIFSSNVIINPEVRIGSVTMIQSGCRVSQDIPPYIVAVDNPVRYGGLNPEILAAQGISDKVRKHIANSYRILYNSGTSLDDAILQIGQQVQQDPEVVKLRDFIKDTKLGIAGR